MNLNWKAAAQVGKLWSTLLRNIKRNEDYFIKITLAMMLANLFVYTIKSDVAYTKQTVVLNGVTSDLEGLRADLINEIMLSALDSSLKDTKADRQKLIKRDMILLIKKHSVSYPYIEQRDIEEEPEAVEELEDEDETPADGGRVM